MNKTTEHILQICPHKIEQNKQSAEHSVQILPHIKEIKNKVQRIFCKSAHTSKERDNQKQERIM